MKERILIFITSLINYIPVLNRLFYTLSKRYIDVFRNYSYDFNRNGESKLLKRVSTYYSSNSHTFLDVGCNRGEWSKKFFKYFPKAKGYLFDLNEHLKDQVHNNLKDFDFKLEILALNDETKKISFIDYGGLGNINTTVIGSNFHNKKSVYKEIFSQRGDEYCKENKIEQILFLKIDTEGADLNVLKGFESLLKRKRIKIIQFEYGYTNGDSKSLMKDFYNFLQPFGYKISRLSNQIYFRDFKYSDNDFKSGPNYIATYDQDLINFLQGN